MAGDIDPQRRPSDPAESPAELRDGAAFASLRRIALVVLPVAVAASVFLAYQNRSGVENAAEESTQAISATIETPTNGDEAADGEDDDDEEDAPGQAGTDAESPEQADESEASSEQAEFSAAAAEQTSAAALDVAVEINWALGSGGNSTSVPFLPLNGTVQNIELPNYDRDQNDDPGRTIQIGDGLDETDPTKTQRWLAEPGDASQLVGRPTLELWLATKDFDTEKSGRVVTGLYECSAEGDDCNLLAEGDTVFNQSTFGADFGRVTINMSELSTSVDPDRALLIKLVVDERSEADLWLAYGTTAYRTVLSLG